MSYRLTLLGERIRKLIIAFATGIAVSILGLWVGFSNRYICELSDAWKIFAGWFPIMIIILGIITSNSDKRYAKLMSEHKITESLINDVIICSIIILLTAFFLFIHGLWATPPTEWTFICTTFAIATVCILVQVSLQIFKVSKCIAQAESNCKEE